ATPRTSDIEALRDPLDQGNIGALVAGRHGAPFDVFGPRLLTLEGRQIWNVRAFLPGATGAWVIPGALAPVQQRDEATLPPTALPMHPLHHADLFTLLAPAELAGPYHLAVARHGRVEGIADPYAFAPLLTDFDMHLIGEGTHRDAYERLGAH